MTEFPVQSRVRNLLLRVLSPSDIAVVAPHVPAVDLPIRKPLVEPDVSIDTVWCLETAIASMISMSSEGHQSESGFIGRCGFLDMNATLRLK